MIDHNNLEAFSDPINYDKEDAIRGMDIIIVTTAKSDAEAKALLRGFSMPFSN